MLTCACCMKMFHADTKKLNFAQITALEEKLILLKTPIRMIYRCLKCTTEGCFSSTLEVLVQDLNKRLDKMSGELDAITDYKKKVDHALQTFDEIQSNEGTKAEKNKNIEEKTIDLSDNVIPSVKSELETAIIKESRERDIKKNNIIVLKLKDNNNVNEDKNFVDKILSLNQSIDKNIKFYRLGVFTENKNRPLRLICKNNDDTKWILINNKEILKKLNVEVIITNERTALERKLYNDVRKQLL